MKTTIKVLHRSNSGIVHPSRLEVEDGMVCGQPIEKVGEFDCNGFRGFTGKCVEFRAPGIYLAFGTFAMPAQKFSEIFGQ